MNNQFDFQGALKKGFTPEEITTYLKKNGREKEAVDYFGIKSGNEKKDNFFTRLGRTAKNVGQEIKGDIKETIQGIGGALSTARDKMEAGYRATEMGEQSLAEGLFQGFGEGARGVSNVIGETVIGAGKALLPQQAEDAIRQTTERVVKPIVEDERVKGVIERYNTLKQNNPEFARNIEATLGIGELFGDVLTGFGAKRGAQALLDVGSDIAQTTARTADNLIDRTVGRTVNTISDTTSKIAGDRPQRWIAAIQRTATPEMVEQEVQGLKNTWTEFFNENKSLKNKLMKEQGFDRDPAEVLARSGYIPEIENGRFNADEIIKDIGNDVEEAVDAIDTYVAKLPNTVSLNEMRNRVKQYVQSSEKIKSTGTMQPTLNEIDRKFDDLIAANGNNVSLTTINNIRKNSNRTTTAFDSDVYEMDVADAIGKVSRNVIDEVTGDDSIRKLNAEIAEKLSAAKMAKAFNGGAVRFGRFSQWAARLIGALAGSDTGIPVIGPLLGALGGDMVIDLLQKQAFGGEIRERILETLRKDKSLLERVRQKASDIDAFDEALKKELQKPERQLPAPKKNIVPGETPLLPKETERTIEMRERNNPSIRDPRASNPLIKAKNIHPEDQQVMIDFIDAVRIGKSVNKSTDIAAMRLAEKFGINADKGAARMANDFEKILLGEKKVVGTAVPGSVKKSL